MTNKDEHALLSASGANRWIGCYASTSMEYGLAEETSENAEEGIKAHKLASDELDYRKKIFKLYLPESKRMHPIDLCDDKEMSGYVFKYLLYLDYLGIHDIEDKGVFLWEHRVDFSNAVINGYGTADAIVINFKKRHVDVVDLKYGFNKVEAKDNMQLLLYAIGVMNYIYDNEKFEGLIHSITLHIAQPRINNYDSWKLTHVELIKWIKYFQYHTVKALVLDDNFNPSIEACKYCKAKTRCPALSSFVKNLTDQLTGEMNQGILFETSQDKKVNLSNELMKKVLDNSELIKDYLRTIETLATNRILGGENIDGYKVVHSKTNRQLNKDAEESLVSMFGDKVYKKSLLGLGELEKSLGAGVVNEFTFKPEGKPTIVKNKDTRPSINEVLKFDKID